MASRFARSGFARFRAMSPTSRLLLGLSGSLGLYHASKSRKIYADSSLQNPDSRRVEYSISNPENGVDRVDWVSWPANFPCEDVIASKYIKPTAWSFWAVYDGHVGPQTAWHLDQNLIPNLISSLFALYSTGPKPETETIHDTIKRVFLVLDNEMVAKSAQLLVEQPEGTPIKAMAARVLQTARAGSCALVSFYDAHVRRLHVSVVGDSRAILGRRRTTEDGKTRYEVHVLSLDQTGRNPAEIAQVAAEHPGEALVEKGRFLGDLQTFLQEKCLGDKPRPTCLTPPYFTATPEITTTAIEPGDFMIMASDGLWDCLTNEEAVGLVGVWLESDKGRNEDVDVIKRTDLPVELTDDKTHYASWKVEKNFVNVDTNVARHLARNALGSADQDLHLALLSTPAPRIRYFRDDVSAVVVFFE
ncbi:phosphatase 2C-like domain-containing protein [Mycena galericulata]|nr:phosphatase 2C-like domain-containing protein [Mycena galericulata]